MRKSRKRVAGVSAAALAGAGALLATSLSAPPAAADVAAPGDNPYEGSQLYVNPDWQASAIEGGGAAIADTPTAVWLDSIGAITSGSDGNNNMGLREHMDEALAQGADAIQIVTYNLPGRDCAALASRGELGPDQIDEYKTDFIDPIDAILEDPAYADLKIINIVEIDSLPNLITNVGGRETATPECDEMKANGNYVKGVGYNLGTLGDNGNVYNYIDIGHHGWIGWDDNFQATADLLYEAANAEGASPEDVTGFAANTANYGATVEPYFSIDDVAGDGPIREGNSSWVDWNRYVDEQSFAQAFVTEAATAAGFPSGMGAIIDTSRNGWGGPDRPTGPGDISGPGEQYVNDSRTDLRIHLGNWCNQEGAGLGERPTASPAPSIHAYAWIKPPGESDGASEEIPDDDKGFDRMCDPTYEGNARNQYNMSGALDGAPTSGHWFQAQFEELMANANPPVN